MLRFEDIEIDAEKREVRRGETRISLTKREAEVIAYFEVRLDTLVTRKQLERDVWEFRAGVRSMAVPVAIRRLREKIEPDPTNPQILKTHKGRGYEMASGDTHAQEPLRNYHTAWIERPEAQALVTRALEGHRLVTLVGVGGMGKTRLAIEVVHRLGLKGLFVDLSVLPPDTECTVALQGALDCKPEEIEHSLGPYEIVVFDNAEHLVEDLARLLLRLIERVPTLRILVTSRIDTQLAAERAIAVPPLSSDEAAALFKAHRPSEDSDQLSRVLDGVDRVPLAIELLAHLRGDLTSIEQVVERHQPNRARMRGRPERQSSVIGAIQWSWELLDSGAQQTLIACALWPGQIDQTGVARLCPDIDTEAALDTLIDHSLLEQSDGGLRVLWMVRSFVRQHQSPALLARWRTWVVQEAQTAMGLRRTLHAMHLRLIELGDPLLAILKDESADIQIRGEAAVLLSNILSDSISPELINEVVSPFRSKLDEKTLRALHISMLTRRYDHTVLSFEMLEDADHETLPATLRSWLFELRSATAWYSTDRAHAVTLMETARDLLEPQSPDHVRAEALVAVVRAGADPQQIPASAQKITSLRVLAQLRGWDALNTALKDDELNLLSMTGEDEAAAELAKELILDLDAHAIPQPQRWYALQTIGVALWPTNPGLGADLLRRQRTARQGAGGSWSAATMGAEIVCNALAGDFDGYWDAKAALTESSPPFQGVIDVFDIAVRIAEKKADLSELTSLDPGSLNLYIDIENTEQHARVFLERLVTWLTALDDPTQVRPIPQQRTATTVVRGLNHAINQLAAGE